MRSKEEIKKGLEYLSITDVEQKVKVAEKGLPYEHVEEVASDALALIHHLESNQMKKPMTLEEALQAKAVWIEDDGCETGVELYPVLYYAKGYPKKSVFITAMDNEDNQAWLNNEEYGITWRCWASRPTEEERAAAKWEEDKRDTDPVQ